MMSREDLMREEREALVLTPTRPPPTGGRWPAFGGSAGVGVDFVFCLGIIDFIVCHCERSEAICSLPVIAKEPLCGDCGNLRLNGLLSSIMVSQLTGDCFAKRRLAVTSVI